jgi:hypothetical protein
MEETNRTETYPWRLERRWMDGFEVCPRIYLGSRWVATIDGPQIDDPIEAGQRIVASLNYTRDLTTDELQAGTCPRKEDPNHDAIPCDQKL